MSRRRGALGGLVLLVVACAAPHPEGPARHPAAAEPWSPPTLGEVDPGAVHVDLAGPLLRHLEALADAAVDGTRAVGTPGYEASVAYVTTSLRALGLEPEVVRAPVRAWRTWGQRLEGPEGAIPDAWVAPMRWSAPGMVDGVVVHVDLGLPEGSTSACEDEDVAGLPLGALAVVRRGGCSFAAKVARLEAAGAAGVVVLDLGPETSELPVWGTLDEAWPSGLPVVGAAPSVLAWLPDGARARLTSDAELLDEDVPSVIVDIAGRGDEVWMAGAHLDSVPAGPGINDNGTGVAAVLTVAEVLSRRAPGLRAVRLAWWGAEELGLRASAHYVDQGVPDVAAYLNLDMVGSPNGRAMVYDADGDEVARAVGATLPLEVALEAALRAQLTAQGWPVGSAALEGRSDHAGFTLAGVPVAGLFTGAELPLPEAWADEHGGVAGAAHDGCYHQACDRLDNVDLRLLEGATRALLGVLEEARQGRFGGMAREELRHAPGLAPVAGCEEPRATR